MRVWFTSQPSWSSSSRAKSMQAIPFGQPSPGASQTCSNLRFSKRRVPIRAYRWRAYSCHSSSSRYLSRSDCAAEPAFSQSVESEMMLCRTYGDMTVAPLTPTGSTWDRSFAYPFRLSWDRAKFADDWPPDIELRPPPEWRSVKASTKSWSRSPVMLRRFILADLQWLEFAHSMLHRTANAAMPVMPKDLSLSHGFPKSSRRLWSRSAPRVTPVAGPYRAIQGLVA